MPSGFVTTTVQIPLDPFNIINQAVTCVGLSHRVSWAFVRVIEPVLFVSLALILPDWKPEPVIFISTKLPTVEVGEILVIPCESVGVVVPVGLAEPRRENMLA